MHGRARALDLSPTSAAASCSAPTDGDTADRASPLARATTPTRAIRSDRYRDSIRETCSPPTARPARRVSTSSASFTRIPTATPTSRRRDLENSCPWYSFVVLSIKNGEFDHANSCLPDCGSDRGSPGRTWFHRKRTMAKILIPTPLRQYAGKQDSVELAGRHRRRGARGAHLAAPRPAQAPLQRRGQAAQLRQRLRERRGHPLLCARTRRRSRTATPSRSCPSIAGGRSWPPSTRTRSGGALERGDPALQPPPDHARGRHGRPAEAQGRAACCCIGTGGLGSPLGLYLAAAGVGRIGLVDFDVVDFTNLQRQILHGTTDVGRKKLDSAAETHARHQPGRPASTCTKSRSPARTRSTSSRTTTSSSTAPTTSPPATWSTTPACCSSKPNVYGSIFRFDGQATVFAHQGGPCYRCLYPEPPPPGLVPSCAEGGVLGILPGIIGVIQATEAIKLILGIGEPLIGRLLLYDALAMTLPRAEAAHAIPSAPSAATTRPSPS